MKKLPQKKLKDVLKVELPPPELKKVEVPKQGDPFKNVKEPSVWELLWLLIKSMLRNKAKDAMEGKPVSIPNPLSFISDLKTIGIILAVLAVLGAAAYIFIR